MLQKEGVQPLASPDDCFDAEAIAKADQKVQERLGLYGITDMDLVACDPWSGACVPVRLPGCHKGADVQDNQPGACTRSQVAGDL